MCRWTRGGACGPVRQGTQGGDPAADRRGGRSAVQARRDRRVRHRHAHGRRRVDQRRLLRPLRRPRTTWSPPRSPTSCASSARPTGSGRVPASSSWSASTSRSGTATTPSTAARRPPCSTRSVAARPPRSRPTPRACWPSPTRSLPAWLRDDPESARATTLSLFALLIGTLQLSRALADRQLADEVLERGIENALALLNAT